MLDFLYRILSPIVAAATFLITHYKIEPELDRRNKKKEHQRQIIEVYKHWVNDDFIQRIGIYFTNFNRNHSYITFVGQFLPNSPEQPKKFYTNDEMTLIHLNCEDYRHIFNQ